MGSLEEYYGPVDLDKFLFLYQKFSDFLLAETGSADVNFYSNFKLNVEEGYKHQFPSRAKSEIRKLTNAKTQVGTGEICEAIHRVVDDGDIPDAEKHNLLGNWRAKSNALKRLEMIKSNSIRRNEFEGLIFKLYRDDTDEEVFNALIKPENLGRNFSLLALLYFVKDPTRYLPISPEKFEKSFSSLGVEIKLIQKASWATYINFLGILYDVQWLMTAIGKRQVALIEAHSFAWMIAGEDFLGWNEASQTPTEKQSIIKARIGQGKFRSDVMALWENKCSVTMCDESVVIKASHIKPWRVSTDSERLDPNNGLMLAAHIDALFDDFLISFKADGSIIISETVKKYNLEALGVFPEMRLWKIPEMMLPYLEWHRKNLK